MKTAQLRNLIRWLHLLGAAAIGTYVYAPWRELAWFTLLMQIIIIPSLSLTGLWLWKGHLMRQKRVLRPLPFIQLITNVMYHRIVKKIVLQNFERLGQGDYESMLNGMSPSITHTFSGQHALGGTRHSIPTMRQWFERLFRLFPGLSFEIRSVAVSGWPWMTSIAVEWTDRARPADGSSYVNEGIHLIKMRWGKVVYLRAYLDTAVLLATLEGLATHGISEALAAPIAD